MSFWALLSQGRFHSIVTEASEGGGVTYEDAMRQRMVLSGQAMQASRVGT